ncbi:hypothetical protein B0H14DRAFT_903548 [Mycena olivaceomarginata]|nr:hypothetical protein B0H14DRAFT_903548 [Mycena olivaceomarginata]
MCKPPRRHQPMRRLAALWLPRPPSQNTSYSPYASQQAPSYPRPRAPSPRPRHSPPPARGAPCRHVPCGVDHDLRIAAPLSRPRPTRGYTHLCILQPHRPRIRSSRRERASASRRRDAKGDVRLYGASYVGRGNAHRGHGPSCVHPQSTAFLVRPLISSFARWWLSRIAGARSFMRTSTSISGARHNSRVRPVYRAEFSA